VHVQCWGESVLVDWLGYADRDVQNSYGFVVDSKTFAAGTLT
jgi:hypothetical protein